MDRTQLEKMTAAQLYAIYQAMYAVRQTKRQGSARRLGNLNAPSAYKKPDFTV